MGALIVVADVGALKMRFLHGVPGRWQRNEVPAFRVSTSFALSGSGLGEDFLDGVEIDGVGGQFLEAG